MSIDKIQLPAFLQEALFKKNLVNPKLKSINNPADKPKPGIDFLGGNTKNIVFIIKNTQSKFLNDIQLKFLSGLINACKVTMDDIAVINFSNYKDISYSELVSELSCNKFLSFGVDSTDLGLPFTIPFFQVQSFQEVQYIFCPPMDELQENTEAKKQLWVSLQKIFKISKQK